MAEMKLYDHVFNPWREKDGSRVVAAESSWKQVLRWNAAAKRQGVRRRVFPSLCDPFEDWPGDMHLPNGDIAGREVAGGGMMKVTMQDVRARLFALIDQCDWLDFLLLTKRPENIERMMPQNWLTKVGTQIDGCRPKVDWRNRWSLPANVWFGVSVENQQSADARIPHLLKVPAAVRFLSVEPMLSAVDLSRWLPRDRYYNAVCEKCGHIGSTEFFKERRYHDDADVVCPKCHETIIANEVGKIGLVIVGGESGDGTRPFNVSLRDLRHRSTVSLPFSNPPPARRSRPYPVPIFPPGKKGGGRVY